MDFIKSLEGKRVSKIGRTSNMLWIVFGDLIQEVGVNGKYVEKGEYSLHLQCPWRIRGERNSTIVLASDDMYEPNSEIEWNEKFDWEISGNNLFDERKENIFSENEEVIVSEVSVSQNGDLQIIFSNKLVFETFISVSAEVECWRFFKRGGEHLVVSGNTIEKISKY